MFSANNVVGTEPYLALFNFFENADLEASKNRTVAFNLLKTNSVSDHEARTLCTYMGFCAKIFSPDLHQGMI